MLLLLQILSNPGKYAEAVKIQNIFNRTNSSNKFKIEAGINEQQEQQFRAYISGKTSQEIIKNYRLGEAGTYKR